MSDERRIEYMEVNDLALFDNNPKTHDEEKIKDSIKEFGFVSPSIVDENSGQIVVGNGRIAVLRQLKEEKSDPPAGVIVDDDGGWRIPVVRGVAFSDLARAQAYLVTDNRLNEIGGWESETLLGILQELETQDLLTVTGYDVDTLDDLLAEVGVPEIEPPPFEGGFAEDEEELADRIKKRSYDGVGKEVVLILGLDEHAEFLNLLTLAKERSGLTEAKDVVLEAIRAYVREGAKV